MWPATSRPQAKPFRDELLSIERLEERALALAASFTVDPNPRRRSSSIFPRFDQNARVPVSYTHLTLPTIYSV